MKLSTWWHTYSTIKCVCSVFVFPFSLPETPWCSPIKVKHGNANCRTPQGEYYKNVLGTRCDIRCQKGYELHGPQQLICQSNKRWSGKVLCKQIRCPTLSMPTNGGFKCIDGAYFNSRCEYYCSPGYQLKGDRTVTCMDNKVWSGRPASCAIPIGAPGALSDHEWDRKWDPPHFEWEGRYLVILKGPSPGSHFSEGDHKIQYTVYDRAENKGTCKFLVKVRVRRCGKLNAPENGYIKCTGDGDNYGVTCEFSCIGGYELQGSPARVCQYNLGWSGTEPTCTPMNINVAVRTAAALLDQFYEKRRLLIVSTPTAANFFYRLQLGMLQQCGLDLRHVTVIELVGVFPAQIGRIGAVQKPISEFFRLLLRIPHYNFSVVVMDKHGMDKERYSFPPTPAQLFALIDTFPLRKEEMKLQAETGQSCT
uniref:Sushi repeat containing protein X-linked n=1 Tax=Terrapene triunguis TaxID=2587831 RepID=A0A674HVN5_9SAUR